MSEFPRITMNPEVMGGKPCIRGMRVTVAMIVDSLAHGRTIEDLLADFPYLEEADIRQALAFAAHLPQGHAAAPVLPRNNADSAQQEPHPALNPTPHQR